MKKHLSLLLIICLLVSCFSGCVFQNDAPNAELPEKESRPRHRDQIETINLSYALDLEKINEIYTLMEEFENLAVAGEEWEKTDENSERLEEAVSDLMDQYWIAYSLLPG